MMLIMPMTTSVVALHRKQQKYRLLGLLAVGLVSAGLAGAYLRVRIGRFRLSRHDSASSRETPRTRCESKRVKKAALDRAWKVRRAATRDKWERETDGTVTGAPLDEARDVLENFYRDDEAGAFELWTTARTEKPRPDAVFAEGRKKGNPVWLARGRTVRWSTSSRTYRARREGRCGRRASFDRTGLLCQPRRSDFGGPPSGSTSGSSASTLSASSSRVGADRHVTELAARRGVLSVRVKVRPERRARAPAAAACRSR